MDEILFDYSNVNWIDLRKSGIVMEELSSVFRNRSSKVDIFNSIEYLIGFTSKRKFIVVAFQVAKNPNFDIEILRGGFTV
jgi:hypothetical protein